MPANNSTALHRSSAEVPIVYDRNDPTRLEPFPDDYFLQNDASSATGKRVVIPTSMTQRRAGGLLQATADLTKGLDGMSPLSPIVVPLPAALDPDSVPLREEDSLSADASIRLFDLDAATPQRVPFYASLHAGTEADGSTSNTLLVFPAQPLRGRGHYAFTITRAARTDDGRNLGPSSYMQQLLDRSAVSPVLQRLTAAGALTADNVALLLSISIRSLDLIADDLLNIRQQLRAAAKPTFRVTQVQAPGVIQTPNGDKSGDVAAVVTAEWDTLSFRDGDFLARDLAGQPRAVGTATIPFTLALPSSALQKPAPLVMYQHGQPGSAEAEVPLIAAQSLAAAGFAVLGFTDVVDREIAPDGVTTFVQMFSDLMVFRRLPDYLSLITLSEQLAFLQLIPELAGLDVLPLGQPDGRPDLDPAQSLAFLGISAGGQHGTGLMAFAPEIHAAALSAAAGRLSATLIQQLADPAYDTLSALFPDLTHAQLYTAIALIQMGYDAQDPLNLARFAFREPLPLETNARACVLLVEGLGDPLVPVYSTRTAAWQLDLPQLLPAAERVDFLPAVTTPLRCDPGAHAFGAFFQFVPRNLPGFQPTPGCATTDFGDNGHRCAHHAAEALQQRKAFFESALSGAPQLTAP